MADNNGFVKQWKIGEGTFGKVFGKLAVNGTVVASKEMDRDDPCSMREVNNLTYANCNIAFGVVELFASGISDTKIMVHMELYSYTLDKVITGLGKCSQMHMDVRQSMAMQLLHALCHMHERGLAHRDLKAQNTIVDGNGRLKIIDFGLARVINSYSPGEEVHRYFTEQVVTLWWRAPELLLAQWYPDSDPHPAAKRHARHLCPYRIDVWSMVVMVAHTLSGQHPLLRHPFTIPSCDYEMLINIVYFIGNPPLHMLHAEPPSACTEPLTTFPNKKNQSGSLPVETYTNTYFSEPFRNVMARCFHWNASTRILAREAVLELELWSVPRTVEPLPREIEPYCRDLRVPKGHNNSDGWGMQMTTSPRNGPATSSLQFMASSSRDSRFVVPLLPSIQEHLDSIRASMEASSAPVDYGDNEAPTIAASAEPSQSSSSKRKRKMDHPDSGVVALACPQCGRGLQSFLSEPKMKCDTCSNALRCRPCMSCSDDNCGFDMCMFCFEKLVQIA